MLGCSTLNFSREARAAPSLTTGARANLLGAGDAEGVQGHPNHDGTVDPAVYAKSPQALWSCVFFREFARSDMCNGAGESHGQALAKLYVTKCVQESCLAHEEREFLGRT